MFLSHNKFQLYEDCCIGFFANLSLRIALRDTLRETFQEFLTWIDFKDGENQPILYDVTDNEGTPTGQKEL